MIERQRFFTAIVFVIYLLACLSSANVSEATEAPANQSVVENSIWYDSEKGKLKPIILQPNFDDSMNRDSRWLPKPEKVRKPVNSTPVGGGGVVGNGVLGSGLTLGNLLGWFLLVMMLVTAVGTIMWALSKAEVEMMGETKRFGNLANETLDEQTVERMKHLPAELRRTGLNPRSEAERLMHAGLFDQAIILLFGHQLLMLDRKTHLRLNRGKTNRRYLRECRSASPSCAEHLEATVQAFERSYFGRHNITADEFARLWETNKQLEIAIDSRPEVSV